MGLRLLWLWDGLIALAVLYFFAVGLADGSVSAFNIALWLGILATLAGILGGSHALLTRGRRKAALVLLWLLALPGLIFALFVVLLLVTRPHWN